MATKLDKDLTRESSVLVNERNILVSLSPDQSIQLKLKGLKHGEQTISIQELYDQLSGSHIYKNSPPSPIEIDTEPESKTRRRGNNSDDRTMINLNDLRSKILISASLDLTTKVKLEAIIVQLLNDK